jgi:hypothetical protein
MERWFDSTMKLLLATYLSYLSEDAKTTPMLLSS